MGALRQDNRGGYYWPGQRSPPDFIYSGQQGQTLSPEPRFRIVDGMIK